MSPTRVSGHRPEPRPPGAVIWAGKSEPERGSSTSPAPRRACSAVSRVRCAGSGSQAAPTWGGQEVSARAPDDSRTSQLPPPAQPDPPPEAGESGERRSSTGVRSAWNSSCAEVCGVRGAPGRGGSGQGGSGAGGSGSPRAALRALRWPRGWRRGQPRSPNHALFLEKE